MSVIYSNFEVTEKSIQDSSIDALGSMETGRDSVMFQWQDFRSLLEFSFGGEIMFNYDVITQGSPVDFTNVLLHLVVFKVFQSIDLRVRKA